MCLTVMNSHVDLMMNICLCHQLSKLADKIIPAVRVEPAPDVEELFVDATIDDMSMSNVRLSRDGFLMESVML